jgi:hypothetical protein
LLAQIASFVQLCITRFGIAWADLQPLLSMSAVAAKISNIPDALWAITNDLSMCAIQGGQVHPTSLVTMLEVRALSMKWPEG